MREILREGVWKRYEMRRAKIRHSHYHTGVQEQEYAPALEFTPS